MVEKNNMGRSISFRNITNIDLSALSDGLDNFFRSNVFSTPDDLVSYYNEGLHSVLDTLAPLKTRTVYFNHSTPWFTPELRQLKTKVRRLERLYIKTGLNVHKDMYTDHMLSYKNALLTAKSDYYSNIIGIDKGNTRSLFNTVNIILRPPDTLPSHLYSSDLCNKLMTFLILKLKIFINN